VWGTPAEGGCTIWGPGDGYYESSTHVTPRGGVFIFSGPLLFISSGRGAYLFSKTLKAAG